MLFRESGSNKRPAPAPSNDQATLFYTNQTNKYHNLLPKVTSIPNKDTPMEERGSLRVLRLPNQEGLPENDEKNVALISATIEQAVKDRKQEEKKAPPGEIFRTQRVFVCFFFFF